MTNSSDVMRYWSQKVIFVVVHLLGLAHLGSISVTSLVVPELVSPWQVGVESADEIGVPLEQLLQVADEAVDAESEIPHK